MLSDRLCECGCGKFTKLAVSTQPKYGHVKGQPMRFAHVGRPPRPAWSKVTKTAADRFWSKVTKGEGDQCWLWTRSITKIHGYGQFRRDKTGPPVKAHRVAYELAHGPIPDGLHVCHRCDVRACVNPAHLFLGTHTDNMRDMIAKSRHRFCAPKLSDEDRIAIRASNAIAGDLARAYHVSLGIIHKTRQGHYERRPVENSPRVTFFFEAS